MIIFGRKKDCKIIVDHGILWEYETRVFCFSGKASIP
jgi:hypothetical protein